MAKSLRISTASSGQLLLETSAYYPQATVAYGTANTLRGSIMFQGSTKRLLYKHISSSSNVYNYLRGFDLGASSLANGALYASSGTPGGRHRLYVAYGGRRYGFDGSSYYSFSQTVQRYSDESGTNVTLFTVPSGRKYWIDYINLTSSGSTSNMNWWGNLHLTSPTVNFASINYVNGSGATTYNFTGNHTSTSTAVPAVVTAGRTMGVHVTPPSRGRSTFTVTVRYLNLAAGDALPIVQ